MDKEVRREAFFSEAKGDSPVHILRQLREETYLFPPSGSAESREHPKTEAYALSAYLIECVQPKVLEAIESFKERVPIDFNYSVYPPSSFDKKHELTEEDFSSERIDSAIGNLGLVYINQFARALHSFDEELDAHKDQYLFKARERLRDLLQNTYLEQRTRSSMFGHKLEREALIPRFLLRGAKTASDISWNILRALPIAFQIKYNRAPTKEEFNTLAESVKPELVHFIEMHINAFGDLSKSSVQKNYSFGIEFPFDFLKIEETKGVPSLALDEEALQRFNEYREKWQTRKVEEGRLGCPAHIARIHHGEENTLSRVTFATFDAYLELANRFLVPNISLYLSRHLPPPGSLLREQQE